jgi:hypothetical protein
MFFNKKKEKTVSEEETPKEPDPIDVHAFIDERRRCAESEAVRIANMLAEEYHGVVEPLDVPDDLGARLFFSAPRAYRVSTGTMRFTILVKPVQDAPGYLDPITNMTEYEKSVARTKNIGNHVLIYMTELVVDQKTGELEWSCIRRITGRVNSENDVYKIREQIYPSW